MKKMTKKTTFLISGSLFMLSALFMGSCSKISDAKLPAEAEQARIDESSLATAPVAQWKFDSSWTESKQGLTGIAKGAKYSSTALAHGGKSAFYSKDTGYVTYASAGTALNNLTTGLTVDFWIYAYAKTGGAQCVFSIPQTGSFWPNHHVLLDGYNVAQGDTGLIKVMFKANQAIPYNERWSEVALIPNFYKHWSHVQYAYNGATSEFTLKVNGVTYFNHVIFYTDGTNTTPLGNLNANTSPYGVVIGGFQNRFNPGLFGAPEVWMLPFKGRIDDLKFYNYAKF